MRLVAALAFGLVAMIIAWSLGSNGFDATLLFLFIFTLAAVVEIARGSAPRGD